MSGATSRKVTETRLRKMAIAMVDMMQGVYEWPGGKARFDKSGAPLVNKSELLRHAGYSVENHNRGKHLFEDPYFKEQVALEMNRREQAFLAVTAKNDLSLMNLGQLMMHELFVRIQHDPGSLTTEQLMKYGPGIYKVGAELEARKSAERERQRDPRALRGIFAQQVVIMGDEQREQVAKGLESASSERVGHLQRLVAGMTALREGEEVLDGTLDEAAGGEETSE